MEDKVPFLNQLSNREAEILEHLSAGLSDQQIAANLFLSPNTIRWYNRQIYSKLGVGSRTQAIARATDLGLLGKADSGSPSPRLKHNLPTQFTSFIGRDREIAEVKYLLETSRLLTLTGMGGIGKTRLALQVASDMFHDFADGVYFVDLAPINDPTLVPKTIAAIFDVFEHPREPLLDTLKRALRGRELLLLIDNFEHVITAATLVSVLLVASQHLKIMMTSREPLRLIGEQEYPVPVMSLPSAEGASIQDVTTSEAGALFVQRVQMMQPRFTLNSTGAPVVAQICNRLDGLPLAIELAAARCKLLSPQALLDRLDNRLNTLTSGSRDAPMRQRTIRDTLEWSYNLLNSEEKALFIRLAIFRGGCSLDAIEAICGHNLTHDVLDILASLVDKGLVQQRETTQGEPRFIMLEMIHEYAKEKLATHDEVEAMYRRHAEYYTELAERAEPELRMAPHIHWFQRFGFERDNVRQVLEWSLSQGEISIGMRLASALWLFWFAYGYHIEGQAWTQRLLAHFNETPENLHAKFLIGVGNMAMASDLEVAKSLFLRAVEISQRLRDKANIAWALAHMASTKLAEPEAVTLIEEALLLFRELNHQSGIAYALNVSGEIARHAGHDALARRHYEECLEVCLKTGETRRVAIMFFNLAFLAQHEGNHTDALASTRQALRIARDMNNRGEMAWCLPIVAGSMAALGHLHRAAHLLGTSESFLERLGALILPADKREFDRIRTEVSLQLGEVEFQAALAKGRTMTLEQAVEYALEEPI
jgi:predicted ATPase/DNA-binding CsgD family transcriptional regulator